MPQSNNSDPSTDAAVMAAAFQFDYGMYGSEMVDASDALRAIDPKHPLLAALETRIRQVFEFQLAQLRARLAGRPMIMD